MKKSKSVARVQNQVRPPRPKKSRPIVPGSQKRRLYLKDGGTTMPFLEGMTENEYRILINRINTTLIMLGHKTLPNNKFIIAR